MRRRLAWARECGIGIRLAATIGLIGVSLTACGTAAAPVSELSSVATTTIVTNARVWTVGEGSPRAEAFAFDSDGVIIAVGTADEVGRTVDQIADGEAITIDADGAFVLPGFQDIHVHVPEAGMNESLCFFEPGLTLDDYGAIAEDCAAENPDAPWVLGAGASLFGMRQTEIAPIDVLDEAVPDRPALIIDDLGHAAWTNTLGLQAAGIDPDTPNPQGGIFHRDATTGRLSGLLLEDAQQLVRNVAAAADAFVDEGHLLALNRLARNGVTSVSDAGGYWGQRHHEAWLREHAAGRLKVRAANTLYVYPDRPLGPQIERLAELFSDDDAWLRFDTAKVYVDGILDLGTARMTTPYDLAPDPDFPSGYEYFGDDLDAFVDELHRIGFRINFHVIGDEATTLALDALERIEAPLAEIAARRHRTTHAYLIAPSDYERIVDLGVVVDHQQSPEAIDPAYHESLTELIGEQAYDLIATRAALDAGATVTLSSDWDAGPLSPLGTIMRSVTRPTNAVPDTATAIEMMTINAAYALGHDDRTGSIEVGKFADFVMVERDLIDIDPNEIGEVKVLATFVGGGVTYASPDAPFRVARPQRTDVED